MSHTVRQNAEVQNSIQPGRMKQTKGQETSCACVQKKSYLTESAELIMLAPLSPCNTHYTVSLPLLGIPTVPTRRPFTLPPIPGNTVVHYADISPCPMTPHLIQSAVDTRPSNMRRHADGWFISLFNLPRRFPPMGSIHRGELSLHVEFVRPAYCLPPGRQLAPYSIGRGVGCLVCVPFLISFCPLEQKYPRGAAPRAARAPHGYFRSAERRGTSHNCIIAIPSEFQ